MVEVRRSLEKDVRGKVFASVDEESLSRNLETKGTYDRYVILYL